MHPFLLSAHAPGEASAALSGWYLRNFLALLLLLCPALASAAGVIHGPVRLDSEVLGYVLQFWVYEPEGGARGRAELYLTDGQAFLQAGSMAELLDREIAAGRIEPVTVVFLDSRDPDDPALNRRNKQFMCNADFGHFFLRELLPAVSDGWTAAGPGTRRGLAGVSFGAINAACMGVMLPGVFQVLIMHSPGSDAHVDTVRELYEQREQLSSAFFISHGGRRDNARATRRFAEVLEEKGYRVRRLATEGGHDWASWRPLLDDGLRAFAGLSEDGRLDP